MKILFCSSEVIPFAKTGGLADVSGALPLALEKLGAEVRVVMPKYRTVTSYKSHVTSLKSKVLYTKIGKNIPVYFIENNKYFNRQGLYGDRGSDYPDNLERFSFFCKEVLHLIRKLNFKVDIIHCNDWQTALIPVYLKTAYRDLGFFQGVNTMLTIHNLGYQGLFPKEEFPTLGLDWSLFNMEALEFYGKINFLKGGIVFTDLITTVSSTYSREIQTQEFGCGLEGILLKRQADLYGIINGLDNDVWNPRKDKLIPKTYSSSKREDKKINKRQLQVEQGLESKGDVPLIGMVGRLADQKGLDLLAKIINDILQLDVQFILLGTGDEKYHIMFKKIKERYPNASINLKYDGVLARKIYAGSDMFLMPSRYEPCGLGQLISLRYGTIPIVRKTGGLADTIFDYSSDSLNGNGFTFSEYDSGKLLDAIKRALSVYKDKKAWGKLVKRGMEYDFSWDQSAKKYLELYEKTISAEPR